MSFLVPSECTSQGSRNGAVQKNFLAPTKKRFARKFVKWERWLDCGRIFFTMFSEMRFEIWVTFFLMKLSCKLNASVTVKFYRLENLKLKEKFKMRDFECFIFQSKFCFFQTFLRAFHPFNFIIFGSWSIILAKIFTQSFPHHKNGSHSHVQELQKVPFYWKKT